MQNYKFSFIHTPSHPNYLPFILHFPIFSVILNSQTIPPPPIHTTYKFYTLYTLYIIYRLYTTYKFYTHLYPLYNL